MTNFKARMGYKVEINDERIMLKKGSNIVSFSKNDIESKEIKRRAYDIPLLEKTIIIILKSGKKYKIKRLWNANDLFNLL